MAYFKKEKFVASDTKQKFWIYTPTIKKIGRNIVFVKGRADTFVKKRRK